MHDFIHESRFYGIIYSLKLESWQQDTAFSYFIFLLFVCNKHSHVAVISVNIQKAECSSAGTIPARYSAPSSMNGIYREAF